MTDKNGNQTIGRCQDLRLKSFLSYLGIMIAAAIAIVGYAFAASSTNTAQGKDIEYIQTQASKVDKKLDKIQEQVQEILRRLPVTP